MRRTAPRQTRCLGAQPKMDAPAAYQDHAKKSFKERCMPGLPCQVARAHARARVQDDLVTAEDPYLVPEQAADEAQDYADALGEAMRTTLIASNSEGIYSSTDKRRRSSPPPGYPLEGAPPPPAWATSWSRRSLPHQKDQAWEEDAGMSHDHRIRLHRDPTVPQDRLLLAAPRGQRAHGEHRSRQSCPRNVCSLQMFFSQSEQEYMDIS